MGSNKSKSPELQKEVFWAKSSRKLGNFEFSGSCTDLFWERLDKFDDCVALIDPTGYGSITYRQLASATAKGADVLRAPSKQLAFIQVQNCTRSLICYLSLLRAGYAVYPSSLPMNDPRVLRLISEFRPGVVLDDQKCPPPKDYLLSAGDFVCGHHILRRRYVDYDVHEDLCLIMATSGSTGAKKTVRLSKMNVAMAGQQVSHSLELCPSDRTIVSLSLSHVFGLSVIHSHLYAGAGLALDAGSIMQREYWRLVESCRSTSIFGSPWSYRVMREIGIGSEQMPFVRRLGQAGGSLDRSTRGWLLDELSRDRLVYFMYGQTEAAGRISVLDPALASIKPLSVGRPVQHGFLSIAADNEVMYRGPNVMMGYAEGAKDLAGGDGMGGCLLTGDTGVIDSGGDLYLSGRKDRIVKIYDTRIDLDDFQNFFGPIGSVAAVSDTERIVVFVEQAEKCWDRQEIRRIARLVGVPASALIIKTVASLPRSETGKLLYSALRLNE